ncbi:protein SRC2-like [Phragmites australis]|uniref:protein SRC2-like n=1 Tax=Phragmites australis TaxID=29695 RepID=UPI002D77A750|nr:protein SRC2-like [Phragmites australis]
MAYQLLEVTLISAKDLKRVTLFTKMRVYAVASISGGDPRLPTHRTYADREGGRNPMWHAPLRFTIPPAADPRGLALHVLLRTERAFGDRDVGEVFVPVQDLAAAAPEGGEQRHLSYQVRRPVSGRKRGVLHISYRLTDAPPQDAAAAGPYAHHYMHGTAKRRPKGAGAITAYPAAARRGAPTPYQQAGAYGPPYGGAYGYGATTHGAPYGYGHAPAARHDGGMGAGLGLGLLGGAVGGMMLGDMVADAEVDGAYDGVFMDSMSF